MVSLADRIRQSFNGLRLLFRKYEHNIEAVDPQLKNNAELVEALVKFENSWEKGKKFFLDPSKCSQLMYFSELIEHLAQKHPSFREKLEYSDAEIFMIIPAILIL